MQPPSIADLLKQADHLIKTHDEAEKIITPTSDLSGMAWLIAQLAAWPDQVDETKTIDIRLLMASAAATLRYYQRTELPLVRERKRMVCGNCGSEEVYRDAWAEWDETKQDWVLQNVFDFAICGSEECDGNETRIQEVEITDGDSSNILLSDSTDTRS